MNTFPGTTVEFDDTTVFENKTALAQVSLEHYKTSFETIEVFCHCGYEYNHTLSYFSGYAVPGL